MMSNTRNIDIHYIKHEGDQMNERSLYSFTFIDSIPRISFRQTIFSHLSFYAKLKVCAKGGLQFLCKSKPIITIHHATKKYSNIFLIIFNGRLKNVLLQNIDGIFNKKYLQNFFHQFFVIFQPILRNWNVVIRNKSLMVVLKRKAKYQPYIQFIFVADT